MNAIGVNTTMLVSEDDTVRGFVAVADEIRDESKTVIHDLKSLGGKVAMLILEHPLKHQKFLAARVYMGREVAFGRVAHDGCGPGHLTAHALQHAPVYPRHGRGLPFKLAPMD